MVSGDVLGIFNGPPAPPCSQSLRVNATNALGLFKALVTILKVGLSVLYSTDGVVDLNALTDADVAKIQEYFRAFCIEMKIDDTCVHNESAGDMLSDYSILIHLPGRTVRVSFDYMTPASHPFRYF